MAYVAGRFARERRRAELSFSHHAEVAALAPDEQEVWLERAQASGLSARASRRELRNARRRSGGTGARSLEDAVQLAGSLTITRRSTLSERGARVAPAKCLRSTEVAGGRPRPPWKATPPCVSARTAGQPMPAAESGE
jgi:hypothetical protein